MSAIQLLCEIIAQRGKASAARYCASPDFDTLLSGGFVRKSGVVQSVVCHDCDDTHDAEIVHEEGRYGYYCPEVGFVPVSREQIEAVIAEIPALVSALADAFSCKRRKSSAVQGLTWRIGAVDSGGGPITLYFHSDLRGEQGIADIRNALSSDMKTQFRLMITAQGALRLPDTVTVSLAEVVEFQDGSDSLRPIADLLDLVDAPKRRLGGRPSQFKETTIELIKNRVANRTALPGRNEEAKAILAILNAKYPSVEVPSLSSVKDYLSKFRAG